MLDFVGAVGPILLPFCYFATFYARVLLQIPRIFRSNFTPRCAAFVRTYPLRARCVN